MTGVRAAVTDHRTVRPTLARRGAAILGSDAAGGMLLCVAAAVAVLWASSSRRGAYFGLWQTELSIPRSGPELTKTLQEWVNDALMVVFFLVVGLEVKREIVTGHLRDRRAALVPIVAALGGMAVPALLYVFIAGSGEKGAGWGIPMATDIAFAVGVLALLGGRIPPAARIFLLTLAIVDDVGAIAVIAIFYSVGVSLLWLALTALSFIGFALLQRGGVRVPAVLLLVGLVAWYATLRSGVHPTIAGVLLGLLSPVCGPEDGGLAGRALAKVSAFVILPIFALANAGIDVDRDFIADAFDSDVTAAVVAGLLVGKIVGITAAAFLVIRSGRGRLPAETSWAMMSGLGMLGGVGFTVSLFIGALSFPGSDQLVDEAKAGTFLASILAALLGAVILCFATRRRPTAR